MEFAAERRAAIQAVVAASRLCASVFKALVSAETITKKDNSPVTVADYGAQAVVCHYLAKAFPSDPIVGEEDSKDLRGDAAKPVREKVLSLVNEVLPEAISETELLHYIDRGAHNGGRQGRFWTLDPIDGTKGFLRGEQFAVCLALIEDGALRVGVMGCPNLPVRASDPDGARGCMFAAVSGQGAFQLSLDGEGNETRIAVAGDAATSEANFCESVEAGHSNHDHSAIIAKRLGITKAPVRMDSQCKYASIARGDASIYLRLPTIKNYEEKIWDHAAGTLIVTEAGGRVTDVNGKPLDYTQGRTLKANNGVIGTNGKFHDEVVTVVTEVLASN